MIFNEIMLQIHELTVFNCVTCEIKYSHDKLRIRTPQVNFTVYEQNEVVHVIIKKNHEYSSVMCGSIFNTFEYTRSVIEVICNELKIKNEVMYTTHDFFIIQLVELVTTTSHTKLYIYSMLNLVVELHIDRTIYEFTIYGELFENNKLIDDTNDKHYFIKMLNDKYM